MPRLAGTLGVARARSTSAPRRRTGSASPAAAKASPLRPSRYLPVPADRRFGFRRWPSDADLRPRARALMDDVAPLHAPTIPSPAQYFGRVRDRVRLSPVHSPGRTSSTTWWPRRMWCPPCGTATPRPCRTGGLDAVLQAPFSDDRASRFNVLSALQIVISGGYQGRGLSARMIERMVEIGRSHAYGSLIAPVRPSWKHRYPLGRSRPLLHMASPRQVPHRSLATHP